MSTLADKKCIPCKGGIPPLKLDEINLLLKEIDRDWRVIGQHHLEKDFFFPDFAKGLDFINKIGQIAEAEGHHPDLFLTWGRVTVQIFTHKINGLAESDFFLAAKIDTLPVA